MARAARRSRVGLRVGSLFWLALLAGQSTAALAHASLIGSDPANDAVLATSPPTLTLTFSEAVEPLVIRLIDQSGRISPVVTVAREGGRLILSPPAMLGEGVHVLSWRVASDDGHPVGGALTFSIGSESRTQAAAVPSDHAAVRAAIWISRLATYLGLFGGTGGAFFLVWLQASTAGRGPRTTLLAVGLAGLAGVGLSVGLQGVDALGRPLGALGEPGVWLAGARGSFGWSALIAAAALMLGAVALWLRGSAAKAASLLALAGVGAALAASGHAASAAPRSLTMPAVALHGGALAFWIGALFPLTCSLRQGGDQARTTLLRFSSMVVGPVAALLASGLLLAVVQLGGFAALWSTGYGQVLCFKLVLVLMLLGLALWNRFGLTPRIADVAAAKMMRRSIAAELVLAAAILGVVGLWRFTPPPRALAATLATSDEAFFTHLHTDKVMAKVTVARGVPDRS